MPPSRWRTGVAYGMRSGGMRLRRRISSRVKPERRGGAVEQPLHHEGALRAAGAAGRRAGRHIGQARMDVDAIGRQHIGADQIGAGIIGQRDPVGRGGAVIVIERAANAEQPAVAVERRFGLPDLVAF